MLTLTVLQPPQHEMLLSKRHLGLVFAYCYSAGSAAGATNTLPQTNTAFARLLVDLLKPGSLGCHWLHHHKSGMPYMPAFTECHIELAPQL